MATTENIISLLCLGRTLVPYFERTIHEMNAQWSGLQEITTLFKHLLNLSFLTIFSPLGLLDATFRSLKKPDR